MSPRGAPGDGEWSPVPGLGPSAEDPPGPVVLSLEVDGEQFAVREAAGGWAYDWVSGPNEGYGFATSGPVGDGLEEHQRAIRSFLSMIDPATGYIGDE